MPSPSHTPAVLDPATGDRPVVHLTRRERIAAERAAGRSAVAATEAVVRPGGGAERFDEAVAHPVTPAAPASPVLPGADVGPRTPVAPTSPVLPGSGATVVTPPAPTSPVVAETAPEESARSAAPAVPFDELVGSGTGPTTMTIPIVLPGAIGPVVDSDTVEQSVRRRDLRSERAVRGPRAPRPARPAKADRSTRAAVVRRPRAPRPAAAAGSSFRRTASGATAVGAVLFTAGLVVSTSLPAQALWTAQDAATVNVTAQAQHAQTLSVGDAAAVGGTNRDAYTVSDVTQYRHTDASTFTNDPDGTIQWPFLTGVPITSGFGGRNVAGCSFCSTSHMGVDFAPGEGTPIRVIAAGTVIKVQAYDGGYGNDVWVEHDVDGKQFVSVYGHMEDDSFQVSEGQQVAVGDVLGRVGSTGNSTGPHLHLEVHVDGVPVDPLAWLKANAN